MLVLTICNICGALPVTTRYPAPDFGQHRENILQVDCIQTL